MRLLLHLVSILMMLLLVTEPGNPDPVSATRIWQSKVDSAVLNALAGGDMEFILFLSEQADLSGASQMKTKQEKGEYVYQSLIDVASRTQGSIITTLSEMGIDYRPFWIANMIWVRGDINTLSTMAKRSDIAYIYANPKVQLDQPVIEPAGTSAQSVSAIEWNIAKVRAPEVWAAGYTGQGITIGGQDTGYDWDHPALIRQYRGWDGVSADHNYSWHDAIHESSGNPCGNDAVEPCDDYSSGHGTHTMGTMVGDDASHTNQIGMAPGAKWIGCRNMDRGFGSPVTYSECYQWFLAPTDLNDLNPDPSKAPHVINNSWSCPPLENCTDPQVLLPVVEAIRAAGILTVHSAGNDGPGCSSINTPAAIYEASFTVANSTSSDTIAVSSSRGPVMIDGSGRMKPDISAPGTSIRSSVSGGGYGSLSGTSMAGPHVAGLAALLFSAQPDLVGQVKQVERLITSSAVPIDTLDECGGIPGDVYPNNISGWGRIDALNALEGHALWPEMTADSSQISPGGEITYTLTVNHSSALSQTTNVILTDVVPANTTLLNATAPYTFDGTNVWWEFTSMEPVESQVVKMTVKVPESFTGVILNDSYQVASDQVAPPVWGSSVATEVILRYKIHFPWITRH
jgi:serine protease AprX